MSLRRGKHRAELNAEINVVSLIDVMMLLLVIFMIAAPMMQGGIEVNLPQADGRPLESKRGAVISVTRDRVHVDQTSLSDADFRTSFKALLGTRASEGVYVQGDANISLQRLHDVLDVITAAGVQNVNLVTAPRETSRR